MTSSPRHLAAVPTPSPVREGYDPFDLEVLSGYSPHNFYVRSTNDHDHDEKVALRLPKNTWAAINEIVQSKRFPAYRTPLDLIRDAVVHRIHTLNHDFDLNDPDLTKWLVTELLMSEMAKIARHEERMNEAVAEIKRTLLLTHKGGNKDAFNRACERALEVAESLDEPYATTVKDEVESWRDGRVRVEQIP